MSETGRESALEPVEKAHDEDVELKDSELNQLVASLREELAQRDRRLAALDEELEQALITVTQLNGRWGDVEPRLEQQEEEIAALAEDLAEANAARHRLEEDLAKRESRIGALEAALAAQQADGTALREQITSSQSPAGDGAALREQVATLEHYIENRRQRWQELEDAAGAQRDRVRELEQELLERVKEAEQLEHRARQSDAQIGRLEQRLTEANLDLETNREVAVSAEGRTGVLDEEISEWRQHAEGLRGELGERTRELEQRAEALERTKSELAEQTQKSEEQAAQIESLTEALRAATASQGGAQVAPEGSLEDGGALDARIQAADVARSTAEAHAAALQEELELLKAQLETADKQSEIKLALQARDEEIAQLGARVRQAEEHGGAAEAQVAALQEELERLTVRLEASDSEDENRRALQARDEEIAGLKARIQHAEEARGAAEAQIAALEQRLAERDSDAQSRSGEQASLSGLHREVEQLRGAEAARVDALRSAEAKITMLAEALADQEAELVQARKDARAFALPQDSHQGSAATMTAQSEQRARIADLEQRLTASDEAAAGLRGELSRERARVEQLHTNLDALMAEVREFETSRKRREQLIDSLQDQLRDKTAQLAALGRGPDSAGGAVVEGLGGEPSQGAQEAVFQDDAETESRILVSVGQGGEIRYPISKKAFTIGRTADNDIQIPTSCVSRRHAQLIRDGDDTYIEDLHSTNGVYVNAHRVTREKLEDGDEVTIGSAAFRFQHKPGRTLFDTQST